MADGNNILLYHGEWKKKSHGLSDIISIISLSMKYSLLASLNQNPIWTPQRSCGLWILLYEIIKQWHNNGPIKNRYLNNKLQLVLIGHNLFCHALACLQLWTMSPPGLDCLAGDKDDRMPRTMQLYDQLIPPAATCPSTEKIVVDHSQFNS